MSGTHKKLGARHKARKRAVDFLFEAEARDLDPVDLATERAELSGKDDSVAPVAPYTVTVVTGVAENLDRLVDHHGVRGGVHPDQLVRAEPQDAPVDDRHAVDLPVDGVGDDEVVDPVRVLRVPLDQLHREFADRRLAVVGPREPYPVREDRLHGRPALVGLEEDLEGTLTGLVPGSHG